MPATESMDKPDEESPEVAGFLAQLESIPWFSKIGQPIPASCGVKRISWWADWPGPEDDSTDALCYRHQAIYDDIMADAGHERERLVALWDQIHALVHQLAAPMVPYDDQEDVYYAPNVAVLNAAWTAGLIGILLYLKRKIPDDLQEQWRWYTQGHWPCGYAWVDSEDRYGPLVVY
jgi:hypothetical protein